MSHPVSAQQWEAELRNWQRRVYDLERKVLNLESSTLAVKTTKLTQENAQLHEKLNSARSTISSLGTQLKDKELESLTWATRAESAELRTQGNQHIFNRLNQSPGPWKELDHLRKKVKHMDEIKEESETRKLMYESMELQLTTQQKSAHEHKAEAESLQRALRSEKAENEDLTARLRRTSEEKLALEKMSDAERSKSRANVATNAVVAQLQAQVADANERE